MRSSRLSSIVHSLLVKKIPFTTILPGIAFSLVGFSFLGFYLFFKEDTNKYTLMHQIGQACQGRSRFPLFRSKDFQRNLHDLNNMDMFACLKCPFITLVPLCLLPWDLFLFLCYLFFQITILAFFKKHFRILYHLTKINISTFTTL